MKVSVIIPVYNAALFVTEAVESALAQPETAEVILVEDGSTDNSFDICQRLEALHKRVVVFQHEGGINKGVSASRNLGMKSANSGYVAFLDADDFFLPDRFANAKEIFSTNPDCDGVYDTVGVYIQDDQSRKLWEEAGLAVPELITMNELITPENLFAKLVLGRSGYLTVYGFVGKLSLYKQAGYFNETLRYFEDTEYFHRLSAIGRLYPGKLKEPVTLRRVHQSNTIIAPGSAERKFSDRLKMYISTYRWLRKKRLYKESGLILRRLMPLYSTVRSNKEVSHNKFLNGIKLRIGLFRMIIDLPEAIFSSYYWRRFLPERYWNDLV